MVCIGPICRKWRESQNLSQSDIAKAAGLSRSMVCRFEKGEVTSNYLLFTYIRKGLPVTREELISYLSGI